MPRINNIGLDTDVTKDDKLLGSDSGGATKSYTLKNVSKFFKDSNAAGIAGQFTYQYKTSGLVSGTMGITFSSGSTFQNATSIKVSKFIYGETTNSSENLLSILSSGQILIVDVDDQDNYAIYKSGVVTRDGNSDFYDITLTTPTKYNGSFTNEKIYAIISIGSGSDKTYIHEQGSASTTWNVSHSLGKFPSVTVVDINNVQGYGVVTHTNENNLTVTFPAGSPAAGKAYCN
jgi:hypothetical protein